MITLDSGDKIRGDASAVTVVDYTIYGLDNKAFKQLADGQLDDSIGDLFTADSADVVTSIILVNTDSSARTCNLYLTPSGGSARRLIPKDVSLGVGYSLHWDGAKVMVMNTTGSILQVYSAHATSHTDGSDDIQDAQADDSTKGIATFEADDFDDSSGKIDLAVSVTKASTTDSGTATPTAHDLNIVGGEGIDTSASGVVVTIAGEAASTTNKGVVELAIGSEVNTGTSTTLAVTPDALDDWTGSAQIVTVGTLSSGDVTAQVSAASTTAAGKSEIAVASEINTGDDTTRTISPKELSDSNYGKRIMYVKVLANDTAVTTGDGKAYVTIPIELNGMNLILAHACVYTKSSSGLPAVSLERSVDQGSNYTDMLSTSITIDENEFSSYVAATAPVIDGAQDDVATGYWIRVNVDTAGTGTKGLDCVLTFQLP